MGFSPWIQGKVEFLVRMRGRKNLCRDFFKINRLRGGRIRGPPGRGPLMNLPALRFGDSALGPQTDSGRRTPNRTNCRVCAAKSFVPCGYTQKYKLNFFGG